jgi:uncharacterized protein
MSVFFVKPAGKRQYHFVMKANNGEVILSSEVYNTFGAACAGVRSVVVNKLDDQHYLRRRSSDGQHYFVLKARNGRIIGVSEMYKAAAGMEKGICAVKKSTKGQRTIITII